ncbi:MAG: hypothetical protein ACOYMA_22530 [Bacteroidia bacterium]
MKLILNQAKIDSSKLPDMFGGNKMDVVIIVIAIIFTLLAGYLVMMDLKVRKIEKDNDLKK